LAEAVEAVFLTGFWAHAQGNAAQAAIINIANDLPFGKGLGGREGLVVVTKRALGKWFVLAVVGCFRWQ
jgi:hypothetical protein